MKPRLIPCPSCGQPSPFDSANLYRPFCCKRCKLIDLGEWASESYSVPSNEVPESDPPSNESES